MALSHDEIERIFRQVSHRQSRRLEEEDCVQELWCQFLHKPPSKDTPACYVTWARCRLIDLYRKEFGSRHDKPIVLSVDDDEHVQIPGMLDPTLSGADLAIDISECRDKETQFVLRMAQKTRITGKTMRRSAERLAAMRKRIRPYVESILCP